MVLPLLALIPAALGGLGSLGGAVGGATLTGLGAAAGGLGSLGSAALGGGGALLGALGQGAGALGSIASGIPGALGLTGGAAGSAAPVQALATAKGMAAAAPTAGNTASTLGGSQLASVLGGSNYMGAGGAAQIGPTLASQAASLSPTATATSMANSGMGLGSMWLAPPAQTGPTIVNALNSGLSPSLPSIGPTIANANQLGAGQAVMDAMSAQAGTPSMYGLEQVGQGTNTLVPGAFNPASPNFAGMSAAQGNMYGMSTQLASGAEPTLANALKMGLPASITPQQPTVLGIPANYLRAGGYLASGLGSALSPQDSAGKRLGDFGMQMAVPMQYGALFNAMNQANQMKR